LKAESNPTMDTPNSVVWATAVDEIRRPEHSCLGRIDLSTIRLLLGAMVDSKAVKALVGRGSGDIWCHTTRANTPLRFGARKISFEWYILR
jgi:hypothetical protein